MKLIVNRKGNYSFLTGIAAYSSGVVAAPGHEIVHVVLQNPEPYRGGFKTIERWLKREGRSRRAPCAVRLRSPKLFTFEGFLQFNDGCQSILADWDIPVNGHNPVARTNVVPVHNPPAEPSLCGFSYTRPSRHRRRTLVVAGAGDVRDQDLSSSAIVRAGESSRAAIREKAAHVMNTLRARLRGLKATWKDITIVDVYTARSSDLTFPASS